ncbi:MAG TPA: dienelactone hydrolase family protein, partial [Kofleriaceae bacterium]
LVAADGHNFNAYLAQPQGKPRGAIIVVPEIFGVNHHIRSVADRFTNDGYVAIAPALFDRFERNVDFAYTPDAIVRGRQIKAQVTPEMAMADLAATRDAVSHAGNVGIVGYCWGGFITWLAAAYLDGITCAVPYYGGGMLEHQDIHPRVPVMGHFGERDAIVPAIGVKQLAAKHPNHKFFLYAADHGFNCDERGSYDRAAADLARERTIAFFRQYVA